LAVPAFVDKPSQVADSQIGTNKCATAKSPAQQKRKYAASSALLEAEVAGAPPVYGTGWANSLMG
jgi:hypothetical protein